MQYNEVLTCEKEVGLAEIVACGWGKCRLEAINRPLRSPSAGAKQVLAVELVDFLMLSLTAVGAVLLHVSNGALKRSVFYVQ